MGEGARCMWSPVNLKPRSDGGRRPEVGLVFRRCYLSVDDQAACREVRTANGNWEVEIEANVSRSVFRMSGKVERLAGRKSLGYDTLPRPVEMNGWGSKRREMPETVISDGGEERVRVCWNLSIVELILSIVLKWSFVEKKM